MANPHGEHIWFELITPDPPAAKAFYDPLMGWDVGQPSADEMHYREIRSASGHAGGVMPLTDEMRSGGARPAWLGYVGVEDVDLTASRIGESGGQLLMQPFDVANVGRLALAADPEGAPFYVMRGASSEASTAFRHSETGGDGAGHVVWCERVARDPDSLMDFYGALFGWRREGSMPMGELGDYEFLQGASGTFGAIMRVPAGGEPGWLYYFSVSDIDRAVEQIGAGGGTVVQQPSEIPGGSFAMLARDPQGATFGLVGPRNA